MTEETRSNPWKILTTEEQYDNPWIRVVHHTVTNPSGNPGIYGAVHFKNIAVGVLPLDGELNTWLIGQYRFPLKSYSWELPEGGCPAGESTLDAAQRELQEETGIIAASWTEILTMHLSNSVSDEKSVAYVAQTLSFTQSSPEDTEQLEVCKLPFEEVLKKVLAGEITDSITVATVMKVAWMLEKDLIRILPNEKA